MNSLFENYIPLIGAARKVAKKFFEMEVTITLIDLIKYNVQYAGNKYQQEHAIYKIEVCLSHYHLTSIMT